MIEIIEQRGINRKVFDLGRGKKRLIVRNGIMHVQDEKGNFQDVDCNLENRQVKMAWYKARLLEGKIGYTGTDPTGKKIELELEDGQYSEPIIDGNKATYKEVYADVDLEIEFLPNIIKVNRIIKNAEAKKDALFRSIRKNKEKGKLLNLGFDKTGRPTKITTQKIEEKIDGERIKQTFDNQVLELDKKTRKRNWSNNVKYPVKIDPTSTFEIGAGASDRPFVKTILTTPYTSTFYNTITATTNARQMQIYNSVAVKRFLAAGFRFTGITIPQGSTINSATLRVNYSSNAIAFAQKMDIKARDSANPGMISAQQAFGNTGMLAGTVNLTTSVKYPTDTTNPTFAHSIGDTNKAEYFAKDADITSLVQTLVTNYDHNNAAMVFSLKADATQQSLYRGYIYGRDWGATKSTDLIIDFTEITGEKARNYMKTSSKYWG